METIGERLNYARKELGKTFDDIASLIDSTGNGIRIAIKRNNVKDIYLDILCEKLNISKDWLKYGTGEMLLPNNEKLVKEYLSSVEIGMVKENDYKDEIIILLKEKIENLKIEMELLKKNK